MSTFIKNVSLNGLRINGGAGGAGWIKIEFYNNLN
jgi:hypothetical protein